MSRCRSCNSPVIWAVASASGKRIPLDPPSDDGNVVLVDGKAYVYPTPEAAATEVVDHVLTGTRHLSHFVTCPQASKWRRG